MLKFYERFKPTFAISSNLIFLWSHATTYMPDMFLHKSQNTGIEMGN